MNIATSTSNLAIHSHIQFTIYDSIHALIEEPNRGGKETRKFKERKGRKEIFYKHYKLL